MRFLFVDRILALIPGKMTCGIKHVTADDFYLCEADQSQLCFIPSLIGETLGQLAAWNVMVTNDFTKRPVAGIVANAKLHRPAYVGDTLLLESFIEQLDDKVVQYNSIARVGEEVVFTIEGALGPLLPMVDFIAEDEIRRQFAEINRNGEIALWRPQRALYSSQFRKSFEQPKRAAPMCFERIIDAEPGVSLCAEKNISRAAPYFPDHFPYKPVLPLSVLLECKLNLAREFIAQASFAISYQISDLSKIKMNEFVYPGDVVVCHLKVKRQDEQQLVLSCRSEVEGKRVCVLEIILAAKGS